MTDAHTNADLDALQSDLQRMRRELEQRPIIKPCRCCGFWARITDKTSVATNRWKYSWSELTVSMSGGVLAYATPTNPRVGPISSTGYAWNTLEMDNTATQSGSGWEDQDLVSAADGTVTIDAVNSIGTANDGDEVLPIVWLQKIPNPTSTETAYVFAGWNTPIVSAVPGGPCLAAPAGGSWDAYAEVPPAGNSAHDLGGSPNQLRPVGTPTGCCYKLTISFSGTYDTTGSGALGRYAKIIVFNPLGGGFKQTGCVGAAGYTPFQESVVGVFSGAISASWVMYGCGVPTDMSQFNITASIFGTGGSTISGTWTWTITSMGETCA